MLDKDGISEIVENYLKGKDLYLVDVNVSPDFVITIEIDKDSGVSIEDCTALNKYMESYLGDEKENFELNVCSSGITRPFKVLRQYRKNIGNEVESLAKDGRKIRGVLKEADSEGIVIAVNKKIRKEGMKKKVNVEENLKFSYSELKYTKYSIRFK